jgi:hypothetical protein
LSDPVKHRGLGLEVPAATALHARASDCPEVHSGSVGGPRAAAAAPDFETWRGVLPAGGGVVLGGATGSEESGCQRESGDGADMQRGVGRGSATGSEEPECWQEPWQHQLNDAAGDGNQVVCVCYGGESEAGTAASPCSCSPPGTGSSDGGSCNASVADDTRKWIAFLGEPRRCTARPCAWPVLETSQPQSPTLLGLARQRCHLGLRAAEEHERRNDRAHQ